MFDFLFTHVSFIKVLFQIRVLFQKKSFTFVLFRNSTILTAMFYLLVSANHFHGYDKPKHVTFDFCDEYDEEKLEEILRAQI